jgi:hypothetical protein
MSQSQQHQQQHRVVAKLNQLKLNQLKLNQLKLKEVGQVKQK